MLATCQKHQYLPPLSIFSALPADPSYLHDLYRPPLALTPGLPVVNKLRNVTIIFNKIQFHCVWRFIDEWQKPPIVNHFCCCPLHGLSNHFNKRELAFFNYASTCMTEFNSPNSCTSYTHVCIGVGSGGCRLYIDMNCMSCDNKKSFKFT